MDELIKNIKKFNRDRSWERFHSPKNVAMALMIEAGELAENFQWLTEEESRNLDSKTHEKVKDEIGDVLIYLLNIADTLDINPIEAAQEKLKKNKMKYPVHLAKGKADKYSNLKR